MSVNNDGTCSFSVPTVSGSPAGCVSITSSSCSTAISKSMCIDTVVVHFDQFPTSTTSLVFPGFTIASQDEVLFPLTIFDSAVPTGDTALGTPNSTIGGGPGIGAAGAAGMPGENATPQYKILIISNTNPPGPSPVPRPSGGVITLNFIEDVTMRQVQLLNVTQPCTQLQTYDFDGAIVETQYAVPLGANSFQKVNFGGSTTCCNTTSSPCCGTQTTQKPVRSMKITLLNDAAVCKIIYDQCQNPALPCVELICEDWKGFAEGSTLLNFTGGTVISGNVLTPATILNTSTAPAPLASPNASPPVPSLGNALIISNSNPPGVPPVANPAGGQLFFTFTNPVVVKEVDFLNATLGTTIALYDANSDPTDLVTVPFLNVPNSYQKIQMTLPYLTKYMTITLTGVTAVPQVCYTMCEAGGGGPPGPPVPVVMTIVDFANVPSIVPTTSQQGTYMLLVKSVNPNGASATFMASSAYAAQVGSVVRLTGAPSLTAESLQISWPANSDILLFHDIAKTGASGVLIPYDVIVSTI